MERFLIEKNVRKNFQNFSQKSSSRLPSLFSSIFFEFFYTIVLLMAYSNKLDCVRGFFKKSRLGWVSPFLFFAKNELFERLKMKISHWTRRRSKNGKNGQELNLQHAFSMFRMCSRISNSHYRQLLVTKI